MTEILGYGQIQKNGFSEVNASLIIRIIRLDPLSVFYIVKYWGLKNRFFAALRRSHALRVKGSARIRSAKEMRGPGQACVGA